MQVIATAGHVDHGKSALVRALTGMEPDRWAEERRRGLTIDLGFAWLTLPGGQRLAFVDVPGHERFVPNMLAGVGPVPAVLFVVAADGGWMPQSAEHLAALDALGISRGLLAVTRADLADPGPAISRARAEIGRSSLGDVPAVAVSSVTGQGLPELRTALAELAAGLPRPDPAAPVRLWLDRVFSVTGSGTVVTGTLPAGTISVGDELQLTPARRPARIRDIQSLGERIPEISGVARVALNLRGGPASELARGMALVRPGAWTLTSTIDIRLTPPASPDTSPAGTRQVSPAGDWAAAPAEVTEDGPAPRLPRQLTVHIGSARTLARVRPLGGPFARLTLREPLPLHVADRLLLRDPGAARGPGRPGAGAADRQAASAWPGIIGAIVLDISPPPVARRGAAAAAHRELAAWPAEPGASHLVRRHGLIRSEALRAMGLTVPLAARAGPAQAGPPRGERCIALAGARAVPHSPPSGPASAPDRPASAVSPSAPARPVSAEAAAVAPPGAVRDGCGTVPPGTGAVSHPPPSGPAPAPDQPGPVGQSHPEQASHSEQVARPGLVSAAGWVVDPGHWASLRDRLGRAVEDHAAREPLAVGMPLEAARAAVGLPDRQLAEALAAEQGADRQLVIRDGYVCLAAGPAASAGDGEPHRSEKSDEIASRALPAALTGAVRSLRDDLAAGPFRAPEAGRLRQLGLDRKAIAAAARAGLLLRISPEIVLAPGADAEAARVLAGLPQPFTTAQARQALQTTRRVAIPLLEYLDRAAITRRLPDDTRMLNTD